MNKILYLGVLTVFWMNLYSVKAQDVWQHIKGLPCEETSSIIQDEEGYIWIGTRLGLVRYDGYSKNFYRNDMNHPHAFSSSDIKCLAHSSDGRIFAGSFFGLNTFDRRTQDVEYTHFDGSDFIRTVHYDTQKRLWVGTNYGLYLLEANQQHTLYNHIPKGVIQHIDETPQGDILVVTLEHGIYRIDEKNYCVVIKGTKDISPTTTVSFEDGSIWVGTNKKGLYAIKENALIYHKGYEDLFMNDLLISPRGGKEMMIATNNGVYHYPLRTEMQALEGKNVQSLCLDKDGNVWATTETQGVFFNQNIKVPFTINICPFTKHTTPIISQFDVKHLKDTTIWKRLDDINAIHETPDGTTYIGTWHNGLYITRGNAIKRHITKQNTPWLHDNSIYNISTLNDDSILIGTWHGLYLAHKEKNGAYIHHLGRSDISGVHTLSANIIDENDIWLGLVGGIAHIRGSLQCIEDAEIIVYTHTNKCGVKNPADVGSLIDLHDDVGEYQLGGVFRIVEDQWGRIWACTSEPGLLLYDVEHDCFRCVSKQLGIPGDNVHSLDVDENGHFWMTTNFGILQMVVNKEGLVAHRKLYALDDGLPTSYYGSTMSTKLGDGRLCFVNQECIITVRPVGSILNDEVKPSYLSDIFVNNVPLVDCACDFDHAPPYTKNITLPYYQNDITFCFSSLSFGHEASTRFYYKMEGIDNEYMQTEMGVNNVRYSQIPPGTYKLYYCVQGIGAECTSEGQILVIKVKEPLWWCWWSKILYAAVFLFVSYIIIHGVIDRNRKQQQLRFLEMERVKQEEFYQKRMNFYLTALHEFLTPLTIMKEMIGDLQKKVRPSLQARLFMLANQSERLADVLNNMVDVKEDVAVRDILEKAKEMSQVDRDFLHKCIESVNNHISDVNYSHKVMMREVGASHATLYRKLKLLTGMDATSFIRSIRMKAASQILTFEPNIRVHELSERVGYNNPGYFSTCFKNEFGVTPREYQQKESIM